MGLFIHTFNVYSTLNQVDPAYHASDDSIVKQSYPLRNAREFQNAVLEEARLWTSDACGRVGDTQEKSLDLTSLQENPGAGG